MIQREQFEKAADDLKNSAYPTQVEATVLIDGKPETFTAFGVGLSKRELFAAMAMQGLCVPATPGSHNSNMPDEAMYKAQMAVLLADSLLVYLAKDPA